MRLEEQSLAENEEYDLRKRQYRFDNRDKVKNLDQRSGLLLKKKPD